MFFLFFFLFCILFSGVFFQPLKYVIHCQLRVDIKDKKVKLKCKCWPNMSLNTPLYQCYKYSYILRRNGLHKYKNFKAELFASMIDFIVSCNIHALSLNWLDSFLLFVVFAILMCMHNFQNLHIYIWKHCFSNTKLFISYIIASRFSELSLLLALICSN